MADATIEALQSIYGGITVDAGNGFVTLNAPLTLPAQVAGNILPCALTFVGPMQGGKFGTTTYVSMILLAIVAQGINPEPVFALGNALLREIRAAFRPLGSVNGFAIAKGGNPTTTGGFGSPYGTLHLIKYAGQEAYGFEWHVPLIETR